MLPNGAQDALSQLKDIHVPSDVDMFPLAWGWWVVSILSIIAIGLLVTALWRKWHFNRARRAALVELQQIDLSSTTNIVAMQCNTILKRLFLHYYPTQDVASVSGEAWLETLLNSQPKASQREYLRPHLTLMQQQLYRNTNLSREALQQIHTACVAIARQARFSRNRVQANRDVTTSKLKTSQHEGANHV